MTEQGRMQFPDWAPRELVSRFANSHEPEPILERLLTDQRMHPAWQALRKAGMKDSPFTRQKTFFDGVEGEADGYVFEYTSIEFQRSPMGLYERIHHILNFRKSKKHKNRRENEKNLEAIENATKELISALERSGFDIDHRDVSEYAQFRMVEPFSNETDKKEVIELLRRARAIGERASPFPVRMTHLLREHVMFLRDPERFRIFHSPADSVDGDLTYFVSMLSSFMRNFYRRPLHSVVAEVANMAFDLSAETCHHRAKNCSEYRKELTGESVKRLIKPV